MRSNLRLLLLSALAGAGCAKADTTRVCSPLLSWASPARSCRAVVVAEPEPPPPPPAAEPEPEPEPKVEVKEETIDIADTVQFETDSSVLLPESETLLQQVAEVLQKHPELKVVQIEGHTDDRASDEHNLKLSKDRAQSVKKFLVAQGVDAKRLTTKGFGESDPVADNSTEEGRFKNRRVVFRIMERE